MRVHLAWSRTRCKNFELGIIASGHNKQTSSYEDNLCNTLFVQYHCQFYYARINWSSFWITYISKNEAQESITHSLTIRQRVKIFYWCNKVPGTASLHLSASLGSSSLPKPATPSPTESQQQQQHLTPAAIHRNCNTIPTTSCHWADCTAHVHNLIDALTFVWSLARDNSLPSPLPVMSRPVIRLGSTLNRRIQLHKTCLQAVNRSLVQELRGKFFSDYPRVIQLT